MTDWVDTQKVPGLKMEVLQNEGMTPLIYMEVAATDPDAGTVLLYGHLDKQPPFEGWVPPWAPYDPIMTKDGKLYGRGGADDGYGAYLWSRLTVLFKHYLLQIVVFVPQRTSTALQ
jgi:acetylornithine deacetylase/succinyl-diaminopimelate desuccinylase-like protein